MEEKNTKTLIRRGIIIFILFAVVLCSVYFIIDWANSPQHLLENSTLPENSQGYLDQNDGFYIGELSGGKISGEGQYVLDTGSSYDGEWDLNSSPSGQGVLVINGVGTYTGEFLEGKRSGQGKFVWENGDEFSGTWESDKINGSGILVFENGTKLSGTFQNNTFSSGEFAAKIDIGTITIDVTKYSSNEATLVLNNSTKYVGKLKNGKFNGACTISYANGDSYVGNLSNNLKSGTGTYTWDNGASYVGDWENDKMNGKGTYYYGASKYGKRLIGSFADNKPIGSLTYYDADGDKFTTNWENGKCIAVVED